MLEPPSLLTNFECFNPDSPTNPFGAPGRLSIGPGVLIPNTELGTSRLALEVVVPLF
jgi:hypothetical protein